jgi:hypothetical protein
MLADIDPDLAILAVFGVIVALYFIAVIFERFLPGDDLTEYYKAVRRQDKADKYYGGGFRPKDSK